MNNAELVGRVSNALMKGDMYERVSTESYLQLNLPIYIYTRMMQKRL